MVIDRDMITFKANEKVLDYFKDLEAESADSVLNTLLNSEMSINSNIEIGEPDEFDRQLIEEAGVMNDGEAITEEDLARELGVEL